MPHLTPLPDRSRPLVRLGRRQRLMRGVETADGRDRRTGDPRGAPAVAVIGGAAAFGSAAETPWPARLARRLGAPVLNLGVEGAGPGFFLDDPALLDLAATAPTILVEATGLWTVSNRLYTVGRRYPCRMGEPAPELETLFPGVRFGDFADVGRMLRHLAWRDAAAFAQVEIEARIAWTARMASLLERLGPSARLVDVGATARAAPGPDAPAPSALMRELDLARGASAAPAIRTPADGAAAHTSDAMRVADPDAAHEAVARAVAAALAEEAGRDPAAAERPARSVEAAA